MNKRAFIIACFLVISINTDLKSQDIPKSNELNFSASFIGASSNGFSSSVFLFDLAYGRFIIPTVELGTELTILDSDGIDPTGEISVFASYHINRREDSRTIPFFGIQVGKGIGKRMDERRSYGGFLGLKMYISQSSAITVKPFFLKRKDKSGYSIELNEYGILSGVSILF